MKVKAALQNHANQFEEAICSNPTLTSEISKEYLESVRGHYLSALAGLNTGKQGQAQVFHSLDAFSALKGNDLEQVAEAKKTHVEGQLNEGHPFTKVDMEVVLSNGVIGASEKKLPAFKVQLNKTLVKNNEQISEMSAIEAFEQKAECEATKFEANRTFLSESGVLTGSLLKGAVEGSSLQRMVKSLKTELENLKKEHPELKDKGAGAEFAAGNMHFKLVEKNFADECGLVNESTVRKTLEETVEDKKDIGDLKIKGKGLKRELETSKVSYEGEKKSRLALGFDEAKGSKVKPIVRNKSLAGIAYPVCISKSESSARMMFSEDELEASSLKEEKDKLEGERLTTTTGRDDSEKYDYSSEFSIRDYVFAARNKDISLSWPFSQKNLQLCLKCGVKDVLPPFQPIDSLRESSTKRFVAETSCNSEESKLDNKPLLAKKHLVAGTAMDDQWNQELAEGYRDLDSFPSGVEKGLTFKTMTTANSEVESVSTSNLPLSELSDERAAAASAVNNGMKSSSSQLSDKKFQMSAKIRFNTCHSVAEEITSACTISCEAMTSKICPVCEAFSSSSNTTLNAHIDQCLSSQSNPNWVNSSKLIRPRVKLRKIRLMSDICATAPHCTLEDLDRRNGTNWATNAESPVQDEQGAIEMNSQRVSSRYVANTKDDGAVYIDSSGRKIRILSKLSLPKAREDLRPEKQSKKGKTSRFLSSARKRHLAKRLKYLKVNRQKRQFSSLKLKGQSNKDSGAEEGTSTRAEKHVQEQELTQFSKSQEQKEAHVSGPSGLWISSKRSGLSRKYDSQDISRHCRYELRMTKDRRAHKVPSVSGRMHPKKHSGSLRKCTSARQRSARTPGRYKSEKSETYKRSEGSCTEVRIDDPPLRGAVETKRNAFLVPLKLGASQFNGQNFKESWAKSMESSVTPLSSLDGEVDIQADTMENLDIPLPDSGKLSDSSDVDPFEGMRSQKSSSPSLSPVHAFQSNSTRKGTPLEKPFGCRIDNGDLWSIESIDQCHMMIIQKGRRVEVDDHISRDGNRTGLLDTSLAVYDRVRSSIIGTHDKGELIAPPVSSSGFDSAEIVINLRSFSGLGLRKIVDVQAPKSSSLQRFERLQFETTDSDYNMGREISFPEVDPILIPGPPGSDLPSFSDMGSEDLPRNSSLSGSLAQSSGDRDYVVDGDPYDSPLSASSTISNMGVKVDANVSEPMIATLPVSDGAYPRWLGANSELLVGTSAVFSEFTVSGSKRFSSLGDGSNESVNADGGGSLTEKGNSQQCCCSRKEGIPWSAASSFEGCQFGKSTSSFLDRRSNFVDSKTRLLPVNSSRREESLSLAYPIENSRQGAKPPLEVPADARDSFSRAIDCDSASPSAPVLRLMGKDLMVINKERDDLSRDQTFQNACLNNQVLPVSELPSRFSNWPHQFLQGMTFRAAGAPHGQDPPAYATRHFDFGSSNMINKSKQLSPAAGGGGGMCISKRMHANFSMPSSSRLQR